MLIGILVERIAHDVESAAHCTGDRDADDISVSVRISLLKRIENIRHVE